MSLVNICNVFFFFFFRKNIGCTSQAYSAGLKAISRGLMQIGCRRRVEFKATTNFCNNAMYGKIFNECKVIELNVNICEKKLINNAKIWQNIYIGMNINVPRLDRFGK